MLCHGGGNFMVRPTERPEGKDWGLKIGGLFGCVYFSSNGKCISRGMYVFFT